MRDTLKMKAEFRVDFGNGTKISIVLLFRVLGVFRFR